MSLPAQLGLFGSTDAPSLAPRFERVVRRELEPGAWVEHLSGFLEGQATVFEQLRGGLRWREEQRVMYDKTVLVPRLYATLPEDGALPPILERARRLLEERYGEALPRVSVGYYRDGRDSVAWHGDYVARRMESALVATISLGAPRPFVLRSRSSRHKLRWSLGFGDLFVMGGSCQRTWEHAVPKQKHAAPRISVMFRGNWG